MLSKISHLITFLVLPASVMAGPLDHSAEIEVLPGWRDAGGTHMAGLRITLAPGWKTYWRAPGDAGIPPVFSFAGSENITSVAPMWPVPEVFDQGGMRAIGYQDSVVFPLRLQGGSEEMTINGQVQIGVCEEICIPVTLDFNATLPIEGKRDAAIVAAMINRPLSADQAGVTGTTCTIDPISDGIQVSTTVTVAPTGQSEFVVVEAGDPAIWVSQADVTRSGNQLNATVDMVHSSGTGFALDRSKVRITVLGGDQAIDIQGCTPG